MATLLDTRGHEPSASHALLEDARDRLQSRLASSSGQVSCNFSQGVLYLHGQLPTYYQKQLAQEAVRGLHGVVEVVNLIEVTGKE